MDIGALILMGGKNSRMGGNNKGMLKYKEKTFLDCIIDIFDNFDNIYISVNNKIFDEYVEKYESENIHIVKDIYQEIGPMGGIYSVLKCCKEKYLFVIACDMPLMSKEFVQAFCDKFERDADLFMTCNEGGKLMPLGAIYSKDLLLDMEVLIKDKKYKLIELIPNNKFKKINLKELGFTDRVYHNINTPEEYKELIQSEI